MARDACPQISLKRAYPGEHHRLSAPATDTLNLYQVCAEAIFALGSYQTMSEHSRGISANIFLPDMGPFQWATFAWELIIDL